MTARPATTRPVDRCYWAVLDCPGLRQPGPVPPGVRAGLEDQVPVTVDALHAVCSPLRDGRVVVCAVPREELDGIGGWARTHTPDRTPDCIGVPMDPGSLNLLVGAYEPRAVRRERTRRHLLWATLVLLCSALVTTGLLRRAAHWDSVASASHRRAEAIVAEVAPGVALTQAAMELAHRREASLAAARVERPMDAAVALATILQVWPTELPATVHSMTLSGSELLAAVTVEGDAAAFLRALIPPPGWSADDPRLSSAGSLTTLALRLRRGDAP